MYKYLLSSYEFMEIWSIITMILFLLAFLYILFFTLRMDKKDAEYMSKLPINENKNE